MSGSIVPVKVLRNRGVPIEVAVVEQNDAGKWEVVYNGDDPVTEIRHVQFTNAVLAMFEDPDLGWAPVGGPTAEDRARAAEAVAEGKTPPPPKAPLAYWEEDLQRAPYSAISRTLALVFDWTTMKGTREVPDIRRAGTAMLNGKVDVYAQAVGCAFMLANGIDPERVGEVLAASGRSAGVAKRRMDSAIREQVAAQVAAADLAEQQEREGTDPAPSGSEDATSSSETAPTTTAPTDLAEEMRGKRPAKATQVARAGTRGGTASKRGRGSAASTTSSGD